MKGKYFIRLAMVVISVTVAIEAGICTGVAVAVIFYTTEIIRKAIDNLHFIIYRMQIENLIKKIDDCKKNSLTH